ncbi:hypothetical protein chiPu_0012123 [Chiloscyllium punctatum]|uniref:Uncharacterized protein n=1 Tax=Chiloscyllium punctatum TaxID=137246 RepID=A0A401STF8_CHIPU|nr:hypothetical protein [Chiloscyllium punctatum]
MSRKRQTEHRRQDLPAESTGVIPETRATIPIAVLSRRRRQGQELGCSSPPWDCCRNSGDRQVFYAFRGFPLRQSSPTPVTSEAPPLPGQFRNAETPGFPPRHAPLPFPPIVCLPIHQE